MPSVPDMTVHDIVARRGHSALAWEVLRRIPTYREAYLRMQAAPSAGDLNAAAFAAHWGLHFP